jgi:hypothetical protein
VDKFPPSHKKVNPATDSSAILQKWPILMVTWAGHVTTRTWDARYRQLSEGGANRLFSLPRFLPQDARFWRASVQMKDLKKVIWSHSKGEWFWWAGHLTTRTWACSLDQKSASPVFPPTRCQANTKLTLFTRLHRNAPPPPGHRVSTNRCRANMAQIRQSRLDFGLGLRVNVLETV